MARIAPSWMMTLNASHLPASYPSNSVARIRCPVDETGRNSVTPSTMPRMIAISRMGMSGPAASGRGGQIDAAPGELAALVEAAEPLITDRGERRWLDPERLKAGRALGGNIVALEHQPLVAGDRRAREPAKPCDRARNEVGHM